MDALFDKRYLCELCGKEFTNKKIRRSQIKVKTIDSDFYTEYTGENPNYYLVKVCPYCGYGWSDFSSPLKSSEKEGLKAFLKENPPCENFSGARDHEMAEKVFLYAYKIAEWRKEKPQALGNLSLQISWIHRFLKNEEKEKSTGKGLGALPGLLPDGRQYSQCGQNHVYPGRTLPAFGEKR